VVLNFANPGRPIRKRERRNVTKRDGKRKEGSKGVERSMDEIHKRNERREEKKSICERSDLKC